MKVAITDIGSNTVRCVIFNVDDQTKQLTKVFDYKKMLQILTFVKGKHLLKQGEKALINALAEYKAIADAFQVDFNYCFATASLRFLENKKQVVQNVKDQTGVNIELLTGKQEAVLGFEATAFALDLPDEGISLDVGGGSSELVHFKNGKIINATSIPIGSLSLYLKHVKDLFPNKGELNAIQQDILAELKQLTWLKNVRVSTVIGIGGSARAVTKISRALYKTAKMNEGDALDVQYIQRVSLFDDKRDLKDTQQLIEAIVDRTTTVIPGANILAVVAAYVDAKTFIISRSGIREGYLLNKIKGKSK